VLISRAAAEAALLERILESTKDEGLWEIDGKPTLQTLYAITACRKLARPFPMTSLLKVSDGKPISADYGYSYTIVRPRR
jgi:hypothetical protein